LIRVTDLELQATIPEASQLSRAPSVSSNSDKKDSHGADTKHKKKEDAGANYAKQKIQSILLLNRKKTLKVKPGMSIVEDENIIDEMAPEDMIRSADDGLSNAGERLAEDNLPAEVPRLDMDYIENILAWTYCRLAMQNFGDRYRFRTDIYVGKRFLVPKVII
jgi:hypothetical protein